MSTEPPAQTPEPGGVDPMRRLIVFLASAGYVGYIPVASGTFGSLVAVPLYFVLDAVRPISAAIYVAIFILLVLAACWIAGKADLYLNEHDSHKIVIDEVVGYFAAMLFLEPTLGHLVTAFFIFRALDVIKPFPAGYIDEHMSGGWGVTLDDVVSGLYSNLVLRGLIALGLLS